MANSTVSNRQPRVFLWGASRSLSTCFAKCLSFVDGVQMWHEPYLMAHTAEGASQFSEMTLGKDMATLHGIFMSELMQIKGAKENEFIGGKLEPMENFTYPWIKSKLEEEEPGKKYIFVKEMAYAVYKHLDSLPNVPSRHTFLIRHPYKSLTSHRRLVMDIIKYQGDPAEFRFPSEMEADTYGEDGPYEMWKRIRESGREDTPIVLDADDLMNHPEKIIKTYLEALGIPFRSSYITWDGSEESIKNWRGPLEWAVLGRRLGIFDKAFGSSCFLPQTHAMPKREDLTPDITGIVDRLMPGYQEMYKHRIKPE